MNTFMKDEEKYVKLIFRPKQGFTRIQAINNIVESLLHLEGDDEITLEVFFQALELVFPISKLKNSKLRDEMIYYVNSTGLFPSEIITKRVEFDYVTVFNGTFVSTTKMQKIDELNAIMHRMKTVSGVPASCLSP